MCDFKPDCRICGPGPGPCTNVCGSCTDFKRVTIVEVEHYETATGLKAPLTDRQNYDGKMQRHREAGLKSKQTREGKNVRSSSNFTTEGKGSRGWWLAYIKDGAANTNKLMNDANAAYPTVKKIFAKLLDEGMIRDTSHTKQPKFKLTDWGEAEFQRYKSGNPDDMPAENLPPVEDPKPSNSGELDQPVMPPDPPPAKGHLGRLYARLANYRNRCWPEYQDHYHGAT